jgi:tetratricopeptide (TPR) repeat protein
MILFDEPQEELSKAMELDINGEVEAAKDVFEKVIKKAPYLVHAYYLYGISLETNGDENGAFMKYKEATDHSFDYLDEKNEGPIIDFFSKRPGYEYLKEMDVISILREFYDKTLEGEEISLHRFIKYQLSQKAEAKLKYGFEREESGESQEAINAYEDAINIDPENPISHYVLGLAYESRGLEKEAMMEYEKTKGTDLKVMQIESSEDVSRIVENYLGLKTKDGHRVGTILERYFEIIADDPEHMLELLGFIEDLKIESISKIIKSYISTDVILGKKGKEDLGGGGKVGKVVRDQLDFGEDLDKEDDKIKKSKAKSKISFELLWKYKTQRSIRRESSTKDGKNILAGSENGIIYFIDENAKSPWRYETGASIVDIDISQDGKYGVYCNSKNIFELIDCTKKGKSLWKKDLRKSGVNSVAISSKTKTIVISTNDFEIIFYDLDGKKERSLNVDEIVKILDFTESGTVIAASAKKVYSIKGKTDVNQITTLKGEENIQSLAVSNEGDLISVGTREGDVYLFNSVGKKLWKRNVLNPVYGVSVSTQGRVVTGAMNGTIVLFSKEGEQLWKYQTGENIWDVNISLDGGRIISGCGLVFGNIYLFKME